MENKKEDKFILLVENDMKKAEGNSVKHSEAVHMIAATLATMSDGSKRDEYIHRCAEICKIDMDALTALVLHEERKRQHGKAGNAIIEQALKSSPKMLLSDGLFVVEGNAELNQVHINDIQSACVMNLADWAIGKVRGWSFLGVFRSHEDASTFCDTIRTVLRDITSG